MCEVLRSVAATGAEVDEDQENPEVLVTGHFIILVFACCFRLNLAQ
jgi:hypothetical protein